MTDDHPIPDNGQDDIPASSVPVTPSASLPPMPFAPHRRRSESHSLSGSATGNPVTVGETPAGSSRQHATAATSATASAVKPSSSPVVPSAGPITSTLQANSPSRSVPVVDPQVLLTNLSRMPRSELEAALAQMPPAIRSAFSSSVVAQPSSSPYHPPPSALPTTGQYASRYDPYAEREQRERDAEAAREREKKAEESRRKMQFFRMRDQMRSSQFDFTPSRNAKPKSPSYCSLSEISQQHPKRAILQRFDRLANIKGFDNANFYWRKRGEHVSCRTVIPPVMYSDIYTLTVDSDEDLVRWYSERALEYEYGYLDTSDISYAPCEKLLAPGHLLTPCWWSRKRFPSEWATEQRRRTPPANRPFNDNPVVVLWSDIEVVDMPKHERSRWYLPVKPWHIVPPRGIPVPSPKVMHFMGSIMMDNNSLLSQFFWAVAHTEWTAYFAAAWIEQCLALKRLYQLPRGVIDDFRRLGLSAPLRINPNTADWDDPFHVTEAVYKQLLDIHDSLDWPRYPIIKFPGMPIDRESTGKWLPFDREAMEVDWNSPWCSIHERTTISRTVLEQTAAKDLIATWDGSKFRVKDIIRACLQANSSSPAGASSFGHLTTDMEQDTLVIKVSALEGEVRALQDDKEALNLKLTTLVEENKKMAAALSARNQELEAAEAVNDNLRQDAAYTIGEVDLLKKQVKELETQKAVHDDKLKTEFARYTTLQQSIAGLHDTMATLAQSTRASADTAATSLRLLENVQPSSSTPPKLVGPGVGATATEVEIETPVIDLLGNTPVETTELVKIPFHEAQSLAGSALASAVAVPAIEGAAVSSDPTTMTLPPSSSQPSNPPISSEKSVPKRKGVTAVVKRATRKASNLAKSVTSQGRRAVTSDPGAGPSSNPPVRASKRKRKVVPVVLTMSLLPLTRKSS